MPCDVSVPTRSLPMLKLMPYGVEMMLSKLLQLLCVHVSVQIMRPVA